jgi:glycosyltransferase involved in cell wall biosynthesis
MPRLTIGLPVYNGENFLSESIEALLGQTYEDYELIISDNASTDGTEAICRRYQQRDSRIRYIRQPRNIGLTPNHNFVVEMARGELFKWAAHDDLYARDLLKRCVEALDAYPDVILAHSWTATIDNSGTLVKAVEYPVATASPSAPERFRSLLFVDGGDDDGGIMRIDVLRRTAMKESYHHADRTIIAELALHGRFYHVPDWLYFRRDHPLRAERAFTSVRSRCVNMDPRRASQLRHPVLRLHAEYIWGYASAIHRAPIPAADKRECYQALAEWLTSRFRPHGAPQDPSAAPLPPPREGPSPNWVDTVVAGRENRS